MSVGCLEGKVSNGLVRLYMVLYGLTQLCTIFVLVFMTVYTNIFLHKFRIYKIENTCYSLEMVKRATFLEGTEAKFIYNLGIFWLDTFGPLEVKIARHSRMWQRAHQYL